MEIDFSDKIKELLNSTKKIGKNLSFSKASEEPEGAETKEHEKKETKKDEKMEHPAEAQICPDCKKPESECECEDDAEESDSKKSCASEKIEKYIQRRCEVHNKLNEKQLSLSQVLKVLKRGLKEYENNYRPGRSRAEWAFARVNAFFRMASNKDVDFAYAKADSDLLSDLETSDNFSFSNFKDIEFQLAKISCLEAGLTESEMNSSFAAEEKKKNKTLNKPFRLPSGSNKKFGVYVKNDKGNVVMVKFGDPNMEIKRDDPERRKSYRARHNCESPGPKWKANYWSCKMWSSKPVSKVTSSECDCTCGACDREDDIQDLIELEGAKKGLWDNIREKKKRMGKNYKPAKSGEEDRPSKDAWKKAQAEEYEWDGEEEFNQEELLSLDPSLASVEEVDE